MNFLLVISSSSSSRGRGRRRGNTALFAQFAHDLRDVNGGGRLGPLLLLHLPQDDGTQTGPAVPGVLLQLGLAGRRTEEQKKVRVRSAGPARLKRDAATHLKLCSSGQTAFLSVSLNTEDFMYRPYESWGVREEGVVQCGWEEAAFLLLPAGSATDLLHQHVDVRLCSVQDVSVGVFQALHGVFHCGPIYVDPPGGAAGQERPGIKA